MTAGDLGLVMEEVGKPTMTDEDALGQVFSTCIRDDDIVAFVRDLVSRIGDKWTMQTLDELAHGPRRFTVLQASLTPISHRVLTATLRLLEKDGMVSRTSYPEVPPRVEYELTPLGLAFLTEAMPLVGWAQKQQAAIEANRALYKSPSTPGG